MGRNARNSKAVPGAAPSSHNGTAPQGAARKSPSRQASPQNERRSMSSRVGLRKKGAQPAPPAAPAGKKRPAQHQAPSPTYDPRATRPPSYVPKPANRPVVNPQQPGYRQGMTHPARRLTKVEQKRRQLRRRMIGLAAVLAALVAGIVLSVNLLFKVTGFKVENMDRTTPANTGIYTEQQITDLLGIAVGDNLFGFSTKNKEAALASQLPYLDEIKVRVGLPGTVVVKVHPATERYVLQLSENQWATLSDNLRILKIDGSSPDGLILLEARPADAQPAVGSNLILTAENAAMDQTEQVENVDASAETAFHDVNTALQDIRKNWEAYGLLDGVTYLSLVDLSEISFLYQGRVSVKLGTVNNLDYKMHFAANILLNADGTGIAENEKGTLDVSYQESDGEIRGHFQQAEPDPTPEPEPEATEAPAGDAPAEE